MNDWLKIILFVLFCQAAGEGIDWLLKKWIPNERMRSKVSLGLAALVLVVCGVEIGMSTGRIWGVWTGILAGSVPLGLALLGWILGGKLAKKHKSDRTNDHLEESK